MTEDYTVKLTPQAREQLTEIVQYISVTLQTPTTALRLLDTLEKEISSLSLFPQRIPFTEEEPWRSYGVHKMIVKHYLVYFRIEEETKEVLVIAVIHGRRNQAQQLLNIENTPWSG